MRLHTLPRRPKGLVPRGWGNGDVEFGAPASTATCLVRRTAAGKEIPAILVDVGDTDVRIGLIGVIDPVTVMGIDIHIGDAADAVAVPQGLDHDGNVVEDAESGCTSLGRVVQTRDRHKGPFGSAFEDFLGRDECATHHSASRFVDAPICRRITSIEVAHAGPGALLDERDVVRIMKRLKFMPASLARLLHTQAVLKILRAQRLHERTIAVHAPRMAIREAVAPQRLTGNQQGFTHCSHGPRLALSGRDNAARHDARVPTTGAILGLKPVPPRSAFSPLIRTPHGSVHLHDESGVPRRSA